MKKKTLLKETKKLPKKQENIKNRREYNKNIAAEQYKMLVKKYIRTIDLPLSSKS